MTDDELGSIAKYGVYKGIKIHRFKKTIELPRISKILGILKGLQPSSLLDIGTGRGVFLNPLLDTFPDLEITCIDLLDFRVEALKALQKGGIPNLHPFLMDTTELTFESKSFEVVTALEVLEHIEDVGKAVKEVCRVSDRYVLFSVPSKEDDNPEHIHLFSPEMLEDLFYRNGFQKVNIEHVLNHRIGIAKRT